MSDVCECGARLTEDRHDCPVVHGATMPDDGLPAAVARSAHIIREHAIQCTGPGEVTCRGCRDAGWMSWAEYHNHLAVATATAAREDVAETVREASEKAYDEGHVAGCDVKGCDGPGTNPYSRAGGA